MITPTAATPPDLTEAEVAALRTLSDEPRVVPTCFSPNAICARLIALKLASYDYVAASRYSLCRTQLGREALRMVN